MVQFWRSLEIMITLHLMWDLSAYWFKHQLFSFLGETFRKTKKSTILWSYWRYKSHTKQKNLMKILLGIDFPKPIVTGGQRLLPLILLYNKAISSKNILSEIWKIWKILYQRFYLRIRKTIYVIKTKIYLWNITSLQFLNP